MDQTWARGGPGVDREARGKGSGSTRWQGVSARVGLVHQDATRTLVQSVRDTMGHQV